MRTLQRLTLIVGRMATTYHEAARKLGISDSVMNVLYTLRLFDDTLLLRELREYTGMAKQTLNTALRQLEKEGRLVTKKAAGKEKRAALTEDGRRYADATAGKILELEDAILAAWPEEDRTQFMELHERYLESLRTGVATLG